MLPGMQEMASGKVNMACFSLLVLKSTFIAKKSEKKHCLI